MMPRVEGRLVRNLVGTDRIGEDGFVVGRTSDWVLGWEDVLDAGRSGSGLEQADAEQEDIPDAECTFE